MTRCGEALSAGFPALRNMAAALAGQARLRFSAKARSSLCVNGGKQGGAQAP